MSQSHRYATLNGKLYQMTEKNRHRFLEMARDMKASNISVDPEKFGFVMVQEGPVEDWSDMTSAKAEAILVGTPPEVADTVAATQHAIEEDVPLV